MHPTASCSPTWRVQSTTKRMGGHGGLSTGTENVPVWRLLRGGGKQPERGSGPGTLSQRDWDRFIRARRAGKVGPSGKPVSDRTIEHDLKFLIAVLNWASKSRDERGKLFLASNPLRGLKAPTEKNPNRQQVHRERRKSNARCYPIRRIPVHFHVDAMLCPDAAMVPTTRRCGREATAQTARA